MGIEEEVTRQAIEAKEASRRLATTTADQRNGALLAMAAALRENSDRIIAANDVDMREAGKRGTTAALLDRLMLDEGRIEDMAKALEDLAIQPDPLGRIQLEYDLYNGMHLKRVSVPLGVVAVVFEARPNVCADAAGICIKSGNACILRGGSLAANSNAAIAKVLSDAVVSTGLPEGAISAIETTDRAATDILMQLHGIVDVLIPRGGADLIRHCVENSKVPVIETGTGNCHVYVEKSADLGMAKDIVLNSKCRRYGVCNAAESLLVDREIAGEALPLLLTALAGEGVTLHLDEEAMKIAAGTGISPDQIIPATEIDWATEYLSPDIAVKCVDGIEEAVEHIDRYGTRHSEAIVTSDPVAAESFAKAVDASSVYINASTAFTDGGQFGLGAEIGISTQKMHVRGPFATDALTSYKYILEGDGHTRA